MTVKRQFADSYKEEGFQSASCTNWNIWDTATSLAGSLNQHQSHHFVKNIYSGGEDIYAYTSRNSLSLSLSFASVHPSLAL